MSKKSHHFLTLWPWPLTYDLEKLIRSGHYHYQCVYQIWEQSIPWFLSYRVNTIAGGGRRVAGGGRLRRKTITSPDPSDTGDIMIISRVLWHSFVDSFTWNTLGTNDKNAFENDTCKIRPRSQWVNLLCGKLIHVMSYISHSKCAPFFMTMYDKFSNTSKIHKLHPKSKRTRNVSYIIWNELHLLWNDTTESNKAPFQYKDVILPL